MNGLLVLRQITPNADPNLLKRLREDENLFELDDGTAWVDNDHPWDAEIAMLIHRATGNFMLVDQDFNQLYTNRDLNKVEKARAGAKVTLAVDVELDDEAVPVPDEAITAAASA